MSPTEFEEIVLNEFAYLLTDYSFRYIATSMHAPECWSTFHNSTTGVTIHFELGSAPWVVFAELQHADGRVVERRQAALAFLVQERAPQELSIPAVPRNSEEIQASIRDKARQLRLYAADVLRGDFTVFPRLDELADENLRKRNAAEG